MTPANTNNALLKSGGLQIDISSPMKRQRATQMGDIMSPGVRHLKANLLGKNGTLATLQNSQQDRLNEIEKVVGRRNTMAVGTNML